MENFSSNEDRDTNMLIIGELVLGPLVNSSNESIKELILSKNASWFKNPDTYEERQGNVNLLADLIAKQ